ncbi:methylated-DNA--[protein]-cysteine S-methyltransferase, partial [Mycobacterium tuberculosis]|nr:methylated-DNA--[protein]-cysteine S-methyltransferase [Mycobacterium tuberculosis]
GLTRVRLPDPADASPATPAAGEPVPPEVADCVALLRASFAGEIVDFRAIPLDQTGLSALEAAIYAALRAVGRGETTTYGDLAARAGQPGAARAVGVAMARNRWPIVVPCHRVLASDGSLGGFSAPGGVKTKRRLLRLEGVDLD